jgi:hypothetical protein
MLIDEAPWALTRTRHSIQEVGFSGQTDKRAEPAAFVQPPASNTRQFNRVPRLVAA